MDVIHPTIRSVFGDNNESGVINYKNDTIKRFRIKSIEINFKEQINDSLLFHQSDNHLTLFNLNTLEFIEINRPDLFKKNKFIRLYASPKMLQISGEHFWAQLNDKYELIDIHYFPKEINNSAVFRDVQGNFWLNTFNQGLFLISKNSLNAQFFLKDEPILFIKKIKNDIYASIIGKGIYKFNPKKQKFDVFFPLKDYCYDMMLEDNNNYIIFANRSTFVKHKGGLTEYFRVGRGALFFKGNYWVRSISGLNVFTPEVEFRIFIKIPEPNVLEQFQGRLITGTTNGLYEVRQKGAKMIDSTFDYGVLSLRIFNNSLLIGTDGYGCFVWDGKNNFKQLEHTQFQIVQDINLDKGKILMATQKGVLVYDEKLHFVKTLRKNEGLLSDQINSVCTLQNKLFAASYNGISAININEESILPMQNIYVKEISYGKQKIDTAEAKIRYQKNRNLSVKFGVIDFSGQEEHTYYYRLRPLQNDWIKTTSQSINYSNLAPDAYHFDLKAVNPYQQELEKSYTIQILPLWWQTTVAKIGFFLVTASILFFIAFWLRKKELRKQKKELMAQKQMAEFELHALRSQMNPHFVFNSLNAIQYYINDKDFEHSESYLVKFSRLIRMIFDFSRKKTISLQEEINLLKSYLALEKMRFGEQFNYCFQIDERIDIKNYQIPTMLLQPIIENAVNHGVFHKKGAGKICVEITKILDKSIQISISDDGIGITKSKEINKHSLKKHLSQSTKILMNRIDLLNISGLWKISYNFIDLVGKNEKYSTVVRLKITKL